MKARNGMLVAAFAGAMAVTSTAFAWPTTSPQANVYCRTHRAMRYARRALVKAYGVVPHPIAFVAPYAYTYTFPPPESEKVTVCVFRTVAPPDGLPHPFYTMTYLRLAGAPVDVLEQSSWTLIGARTQAAFILRTTEMPKKEEHP